MLSRRNGDDVLKAAQFYADHLENSPTIIILRGNSPDKGNSVNFTSKVNKPLPGRGNPSQPTQAGSSSSGSESDEDIEALDALLGLSLQDTVDRMPQAVKQHKPEREVPQSHRQQVSSSLLRRRCALELIPQAVQGGYEWPAVHDCLTLKSFHLHPPIL